MLKCVKTSIHCRLFWPISPTRAAPGRRGAVNGFLQEVGDDLTVTDMALNKEWGEGRPQGLEHVMFIDIDWFMVQV